MLGINSKPHIIIWEGHFEGINDVSWYHFVIVHINLCALPQTCDQPNKTRYQTWIFWLFINSSKFYEVLWLFLKYSRFTTNFFKTPPHTCGSLIIYVSWNCQKNVSELVELLTELKFVFFEIVKLLVSFYFLFRKRNPDFVTIKRCWSICPNSEVYVSQNMNLYKSWRGYLSFGLLIDSFKFIEILFQFKQKC